MSAELRNLGLATLAVTAPVMDTVLKNTAYLVHPTAGDELANFARGGSLVRTNQTDSCLDFMYQQGDLARADQANGGDTDGNGDSNTWFIPAGSGPEGCVPIDYIIDPASILQRPDTLGAPPVQTEQSQSPGAVGGAETAGGLDDEEDLSYIWDSFEEGREVESAIIPETLKNILNHVQSRHENGTIYGENHCANNARKLIENIFLGHNSGAGLYNANSAKDITTEFFTSITKNKSGQEFIAYVLRLTDKAGKITWMFINDPTAGFKNVGTVFEQNAGRELTFKGTELTQNSQRNSAFNTMRNRIYGQDFHRCQREYQAAQTVVVPVPETAHETAQSITVGVGEGTTAPGTQQGDVPWGLVGGIVTFFAALWALARSGGRKVAVR